MLNITTAYYNGNTNNMEVLLPDTKAIEVLNEIYPGIPENAAKELLRYIKMEEAQRGLNGLAAKGLIQIAGYDENFDAKYEATETGKEISKKLFDK